MAKQDKEFYWRMQGMVYALKIAKEGGVEKLEKEIRLRNFLNAPFNCSEEQIRAWHHEISENIYTNLLSVMLYTLYDSFGFGKKRVERLKADYEKNTEVVQDLDYMGQHYVRLQDYAVELNKKYDLGIDVERIAACEEISDKRDDRTKWCETKRVLEMLHIAGYHKAAGFLEKKLD